MALSYYIYYRVAHPLRARALVREIQAALKARTGIEGRLLRKHDDPSTWMEVYEDVEDSAAFEQGLAAAAQATDFVAVLVAGSERRMERFEASCA